MTIPHCVLLVRSRSVCIKTYRKYFCLILVTSRTALLCVCVCVCVCVSLSYVYWCQCKQIITHSVAHLPPQMASLYWPMATETDDYLLQVSWL